MPPKIPTTLSWHTLEAEEVFARLNAQAEGLSEREAQERLAEYGPNRLRPPHRRGPLLRLLGQFHNVLIYVLLGAALITALLGHWVDAGVILGVVIVNALIGFVQEGKAERALEAVRNMLSLQATVLREGKRQTIPAEELVPGDIVILQSGDKVPADLRLFRIKDLRIDEAILTGESEAVEKSTQAVAEDAPLGDRRGMAYSGTLVTFGQGSGVVAGTGDDTEIGRISAMLAEVQTLTTPLLRQMGTFSRWLTLAILVIAVFTFAFGILVRNYTIGEMFLAAVGLAVAAIPEGLPAILTVTLAIGVQRMAQRNAIIRRLPAVETLGSVTIICSDKTGTLTRNEMTIQTVAIADRLFGVSGSGYNPHGGFSLDGQEIDTADHPDILEIAKAGALCNDASLHGPDEQGQWKLQGDPTEGALLSLGLKAGFDSSLINEEFPRTDVIPFESEHRFMATLHHDHAGHGFIYVKGAPEAILNRCNLQRQAGEDQTIDIAHWHERIEEIASRGQRTLAVALKPATSDQRELGFQDVEAGLTLLGIVGIIDPPREEAIQAVDECRQAGIRVKMITGDHAGTARAIAAQIGIGDEQGVLRGEELDRLSDDELQEQAAAVDVFARTSPEHKLRLVQALQAQRQVVAMTGDGVNDAPALKRADIGVAMGLKGTEAAKEAAEMVLADDNFASIGRAVKEGRTVYDNLKKAILFLLPVNGGEALTLISAILFGYTLPITPLQILWVNMISSVTLAMTLAFEAPEREVMRRPPRPAHEPILSRLLVWRIGFVSVLFLIGVLGIFLWARNQGMDVDMARTLAVNTLVVLEVFYLFSVRYLDAPSLTLRGILGTPAVLIAVGIVAGLQLTFTYAPFMQQFFATRSLDFFQGAAILAIGITGFLIIEIEKMIRRRIGLTSGKRYKPVLNTEQDR